MRYYQVTAIPAGAYPGVDTPTSTIGFSVLWLVHSRIDPDLVYAITKSLWNPATAKLLSVVEPAGSQIRLDRALDGLSVPLHPGAARFYREAGLPVDGTPPPPEAEKDEGGAKAIARDERGHDSTAQSRGGQSEGTLIRMSLLASWRDYWSPKEDVDTSPRISDEVKYTTCYMCACRCGIKVHLKDGGIRFIEGNPRHPVNRGVICGKGASGIMQQYSPAKLTKPLMRVGERGAGEFREIEWDEAIATALSWLAKIRAEDPKKLAFFTGRDQSQSLTGFWATQFGTPNFAAHGGFCSVNMAAAGHVHDRRQLLGIRRTRLGAHQAISDVRRRRGPRFEPDQARTVRPEKARRQVHFG